MGALSWGCHTQLGCRFVPWVRQQVCGSCSREGTEVLAVVPLSSPGGDWEDGSAGRAVETLSPSCREPSTHTPGAWCCPPGVFVLPGELLLMMMWMGMAQECLWMLQAAGLSLPGHWVRAGFFLNKME